MLSSLREVLPQLLLLCSFAHVAQGDRSQDLGWKAGRKPSSSSLSDALAIKGLNNLLATDKSHWSPGCSIKTAVKRREW